MSLLERAKAAQQNATRVHVPVTDIRRFDDQPRKHFDENRLAQLAKSIEISGQTVAGIIHAVPGKTPYQLIDGERRWRAIKLIPADRRPLYKADLIVADEDVIRFLISGIANVNREGFTPLEMAETIGKNLKFGLNMDDIADVFGISVHWAYQIHNLVKLIPSVQALLSPQQPKERRLPVTAAIQIAKIDPTLQYGLAERVLKKDVALGGLRSEVVKTATKAGVTVRTRAVDPHKQWLSLQKRIRQATQVLYDAESRLASGDVTKYLTARHITTEETRAVLRDTQETLKAFSQRIK